MRKLCMLKKLVESFKDFLKELTFVLILEISVLYLLLTLLTLRFPTIFIPLNLLVLLTVLYLFYRDFKEECE